MNINLLLSVLLKFNKILFTIRKIIYLSFKYSFGALFNLLFKIALHVLI